MHNECSQIPSSNKYNKYPAKILPHLLPLLAKHKCCIKKNYHILFCQILLKVSNHLLSVCEYIYHGEGLHHLMHVELKDFSALTELHANAISILSYIQISLY